MTRWEKTRGALPCLLFLAFIGAIVGVLIGRVTGGFRFEQEDLAWIVRCGMIGIFVAMAAGGVIWFLRWKNGGD